VTLAGELDLAATPELCCALRSMAAATHPHVVIDLALVDFMDCSALGAFVVAYRKTRTAGGCLRIVNPQHEPARLLHASELDGVFCLFATLDAATEPGCVTCPHKPVMHG
jgi:anti-sigma B factor antagonist